MKKLICTVLVLFLLGTSFACYSEPAGSMDKKGIQELYPASEVTADGYKWGYINKEGKFIIPPKFDLAEDFNDSGIAVAATIPKGKSMYDSCSVVFIDRSGVTVSGPFQTSFPRFNKGYAIIREKKGSKIIGEDGRILLETGYKISNVSEGMVVFFDGKLYGHMDLQGKVIVTPQYKYSYDFNAGKASVTLEDGSYSVINTNGELLETSKSYIVLMKPSDGLVAYKDYTLQKFGYKTLDGEIAIEPQFESAGEFTDGYAVVNVPLEKYQYKYGLIDKEGNFVIKNAYTGIHYLGQGLYSVSERAITPFQDRYSPQAIFNNKGEQLTDFKYYEVGSFKDGVATVTDNSETFFIDTTAKEVTDLPRLKGIGKMEIKGGIVKAEIDGGLKYVGKKGEFIWEKSNVTLLEGGIAVKAAKFKPDIAMSISYPILQNLPDANVQEEINGKLKELFIRGREGSNTYEGLYSSSLDIGFTAKRNKDLLIIGQDGYDYPIGAAHGMPLKSYYYINLKTGDFYKLADLFKKDSDFTGLLTSIVRKQIEMNTSMKLESSGFNYFTKNPSVSEEQGFVIERDSIGIYYHPYEIAAYAVGFPTFEIPYGQILDGIDTDGGFWNAFDKDILINKINVVAGVSSDAAKEIEGRMRSYETNIVAAVNNRDFSIVESDIIKDSELYRDQQNLVESLAQQNIKEKLLNYDIYAIAYEYAKKEYKVFVTEEVAISYSDGEYRDKSFSWCYTMRLDEDNRIRLCNIEKW